MELGNDLNIFPVGGWRRGIGAEVVLKNLFGHLIFLKRLFCLTSKDFSQTLVIDLGLRVEFNFLRKKNKIFSYPNFSCTKFVSNKVDFVSFY